MIAGRPADQLEPPNHIMGVARFERFFRAAAGLDVDKQDLKRYSDFVTHKIYDLLLRSQAAARLMGARRLRRTIFRSPRDCRSASTPSGKWMRRSTCGRFSIT